LNHVNGMTDIHATGESISATLVRRCRVRQFDGAANLVA
jgi:hypothetical protein